MDEVETCWQGEVKLEEFGDDVEGYGLGDPFDADLKGIFTGFVSRG